MFSLSQVKFRSVSQSLQGLFLRQEVAENPYLLGQVLTDLEGVGLIACSRLTRLNLKAQPFFENLSNCHSGAPWLNRRHEVTFQTANGESWALRFQAPFTRAENWLIGIMRIFVLSAGFLLMRVYFWRRDLKEALSRERIRSLEVLNLMHRQISHDLKSPLSALNMIAGKLKTIGLPETDLVMAVARRLNEIIGKKSVRESTLEELSQVTEGVIAEIKAARVSDDIQIGFTVEPGEGLTPIASADWARLISNLLTNSLEAEATSISVLLQPELARVRVSIEDTGRGIPKKVLSQIGREGFSYDKPGGQGLGLFSARRCIEQAGGDFTISSTAGVGTAITFTLPLIAPRQ